MQVNKVTFAMALVALFGVHVHSASAGPCPCNSDVNNSGGAVNIIDVAIIRDCINGTCGQCTNSCDVDCDGDVDYYDAGVASCAFQGQTNCCAEADGACTGAGGSTPPCVLTTDNYCSVFTGTWHGDLTICDGNNAIDIPAASTWGLVSLCLATMVAATVMLQRRS